MGPIKTISCRRLIRRLLSDTVSRCGRPGTCQCFGNVRTDVKCLLSRSRSFCPQVAGPIVAGFVTVPEIRRGKMSQNSVLFPARCAARAWSASLSSLPARTSASIWLSQAWASNSRNHRRIAASSDGEISWTSCSMVSTLLMDAFWPVTMAEFSASG